MSSSPTLQPDDGSYARRPAVSPASKRNPPEDQPLEGEVPADDAAPAAEAEPPLVQEEAPLEEAPTPVIAVVAPAQAEPQEPSEPPPSVPGSGPGSAPVSARGVVVLVVFFFALSSLCIYSMLAFWPTQAGVLRRHWHLLDSKVLRHAG